MSNQTYSSEFKDEAVRQIVDRGYSVAEISERLGVSAHTLCKRVTATKPDETDQRAAALVEARSARASLIRHFEYERFMSPNMGLARLRRRAIGKWRPCMAAKRTASAHGLPVSVPLSGDQFGLITFRQSAEPRLSAAPKPIGKPANAIYPRLTERLRLPNRCDST